MDRNHRTHGQEVVAPNSARAGWEYNRLRHPPVFLSPCQRAIILESIADECAGHNWWLGAANARTNHVHAVVAAALAPELMLQRLKSAATRRLRRSGEVGEHCRIWGRGGSTRYLWDDRQVAAAIEYVLERQ